MRNTLIVALAFLAACHRGSVTQEAPPAAPTARPPASAPPFEIAYQVSWTDPSSHLYDVQIDIKRVTANVVELQMPVWSPGRYAPFFFARNVTDFSVAGDGRSIRWDRVNGSLWRLHPEGARELRVRYRVFANTLSGTFSVLDTAHANWNGLSMFMYVVGHKPDPVRLRVMLPAGSRIVNGDSRTPAQSEFSFENYDHLVDTPTEVATGLMIDTLRISDRIYRAGWVSGKTP